MMDLTSGKNTRVTSDGDSFSPRWSSDDRVVTFASARDSKPPNLFVREVDRLTDEQRLITMDNLTMPTDWNGDDILYLLQKGTGSDLFAFPVGKDRQPRVSDARLSNEGHWLAYVSDESGRNEVWVTSYPAMQGRRQISSNGGHAARWRRDGKEVFYISSDDQLMALPVSDTSSFETGPAKKLFALRAADFDVMPDGQKFLAVVDVSAGSPPITVVVNWPATMKK